MTCYNTCAYTGCYKRIPYEIGEHPPKYCEEHNTRNRSNIITPISNPDPTITMAILRCPKCKSQKEIPYSEWVKSISRLSPLKYTCDNGCGKMFYHTDTKAKGEE